ncbi:MAG TPA: hypothetical protein DD426_09835 [Clostridiaceae bacterium]|nr:hypothetical protein [Clostridiaceae bacterium]
MEANTFAAELIINDSDLKNLKRYSINYVASLLGVEKKLIEYKLKNL